MPPDTYRTIEHPVRVEIPRIKGSRFIGEAFPVTSREDIKACLEEVRTRERQATHHCWAARLGTLNPQPAYSDAGEPTGTAGPPILRQIEARNLTGTLVVVTRYFGGTKLGKGGLIRAYGEAASAVLDAASIVERPIEQKLQIRFAYSDTSPAMHVIQRFDARMLERRYGEATEILLALRKRQVEDFVSAFTDALGGRGEVVLVED